MVMETREVLTMLAAAQKRPQNKITIKLTVLILTFREWLNKDSVKMFTYTAFSEAADGVISFNSNRLLPKLKPSEVMVTLSGFTAFEPIAK